MIFIYHASCPVNHAFIKSDTLRNGKGIGGARFADNQLIQRQQVELLKQQNKITEDRIAYLKDMDRKIKQILIEWKKTDNKEKVMKEMFSLLFKKDENKVVNKMQKKIESRFDEVAGEIAVGSKVKMKRNHQVGEVIELRGKRAVVKIGLLPMQVDLKDLVMVREKEVKGER